MHIFYRISDGSYPKVRFEHATKEGCLINFLEQFVMRYLERGIHPMVPVMKELESSDTFVLVADNVKDETMEWVTELLSGYEGEVSFKIMRTQGGSSAAGFRIVLDEALKLDGAEHVYFVEDDYCHLPGSRKVMEEGLLKSHYVTLYNHPDKYIPASKGGNPLIGEDGAEETRVFVTDHSYWMLTNSTTMTFATQVCVLKMDEDIWRKYTEGTYPHDMQIFLELRAKGRTLIQPIPTKSTHCEPAWAAHLHGTGVSDWDEILKTNMRMDV